MKNFSDLKTRNELADFLGISRSRLAYILFIKKPDNYYYGFEIPKKTGGVRKISAPLPILKMIQKKLAKRIWEKILFVRKDRHNTHTNLSHAYEKGKSIITNAFIHRNKRYVVNMDLENFFDSIHFGRVLGYFEKNEHFMLSHEVATAVTQLVCYQGKLPQGAPTSPIITNLICQILDFRLLKVAKKFKMDYTRYADDLTFSTNDRLFLQLKDIVLKEISAEIIKAGFSINDKKTRVQFKDSRQEVTGLIVNRKIGIKLEFVKNTRAMAHQLYTQGTFFANGKPGTLKELEGRFAFIDQIDDYSDKLISPKEKGRMINGDYNLNKREREYQKFLFFKYFFANKKPIIITEGKTDILYLKAALQNLYTDYPELVEKTKTGKFIFKVAFHYRTKKWERLFNLSIDGADTIKNLYSFFIDIDSKKPNYLKYFSQLSKKEQKNAVIFIFDNETSHENKKPLKKFLGFIRASDEQKSKLQATYVIKLIPENKVFLATNPLVDGKSECEIEDLFKEEVLKHKIKGKEFCKEKKFDKKKYYGKQIFSKYVFKNYSKIDFSQFAPLLEAIKTAARNIGNSDTNDSI